MGSGEIKKRMELLRHHKNFRESDLYLLAEFERIVEEAKKDIYAILKQNRVPCCPTPDYDWFKLYGQLREEIWAKVEEWFGGE